MLLSLFSYLLCCISLVLASLISRIPPTIFSHNFLSKSNCFSLLCVCSTVDNLHSRILTWAIGEVVDQFSAQSQCFEDFQMVSKNATTMKMLLYKESVCIALYTIIVPSCRIAAYHKPQPKLYQAVGLLFIKRKSKCQYSRFVR